VVPDDVAYGFGRMDEWGRVADRAMIAALGWQPGDRLTLTAAAGVITARRDPGGMVTMPAKPVGAKYPVNLCDLGILADQAAEPVPAENPDIRARSGWMRTPGRRALLQHPVRAMLVIVIDVLAQDQPQVPFARD
jgi:hypothetical protein